MFLKRVVHAAIATMAAASIITVGAQPASAYVHNWPISHNGEVKGKGTYDNVINQACAHLYKGYQVTVIYAGNSASDYSADGNPNCVWINNVQNGHSYELIVRWTGTGGAFETTSVWVMA